ncbi:DUF3179 domain-containing protein [Ferrigenium sp. UT4]
MLGALLIWSHFAAAEAWNGFEVQNALIPLTAIEGGGPPRDGIPTLDHPRFTEAKNTDWLKANDRVLGIYRNGIARAYPVAILNWHEIVNDVIGDEPVTVTYCPLCGSGVAFKSEVDGRRLRFAVSGLLYNSDVLIYDRETESLWSQILGQAVTGKFKGTRLQRIVLTHTHWQDWKKRFPDSSVLSRATGFQRDYSRNPYQGYAESRNIWFSVSHQDERLPPKAWVAGVEHEGHFRAYPFDELAKTPGMVHEQLGSAEIVVHYDPDNRSVRVTDATGTEIPVIAAYWFAWYAFHPDTEIFRAPAHPSRNEVRDTP